MQAHLWPTVRRRLFSGNAISHRKVTSYTYNRSRVYSSLTNVLPPPLRIILPRFYGRQYTFGRPWHTSIHQNSLREPDIWTLLLLFIQYNGWFPPKNCQWRKYQSSGYGEMGYKYQRYNLAELAIRWFRERKYTAFPQSTFMTPTEICNRIITKKLVKSNIIF